MQLYSLNGGLGIHAVHRTENEQIEFLPTPLLRHCPYIASVVDGLPFRKRAVRLMRLAAGALIKEHCDHKLSFEQGEVRLHVPVQTSDLVEFYVNNERMFMREGELWYLNLSLPQRVVNHGVEDRIHRVIDGEVNNWIRDQFARPDIEARKDYEPAPPTYDEPTRRRMIEEFRAMGTATATSLADALEALP